jgi:putative DNA primase/helicase
MEPLESNRGFLLMLDAKAVHSKLGTDGWFHVLAALGVAEKFLRNKHGPCPICGGKDRFRFDNLARGAFICSQCGAGDGFKLLMSVLGISFAEVRKRVLEAAGLEKQSSGAYAVPRPTEDPEEKIAEPTRRVLALLRETCAIEDCDAARIYLTSRSLWPLPPGHLLRAHPSVQYWSDGQRIGRFPALVTAVRDFEGELVTVHVTYLTELGTKLQEYEPRKILSSLTNRYGCAGRIMEGLDNVLGIAEGIETALSASKLTGVPTWAALNAGLLAKFQPPESIDRLIIFADRDIAGLEAATVLMERLQEKVKLEIRSPRMKDWNDVLCADPRAGTSMASI